MELLHIIGKLFLPESLAQFLTCSSIYYPINVFAFEQR